MNLIEKLGIENAKALDGMLQKHAVPESWKIAVINGMWQRSSVGFTHGELRKAIADHDQYWYGQSEEKELEQYAVLSQEKIEGGAVFVGDNTAVVQAMRNITDDCTDIRNHISPCTEVIE